MFIFHYYTPIMVLFFFFKSEINLSLKHYVLNSSIIPRFNYTHIMWCQAWLKQSWVGPRLSLAHETIEPGQVACELPWLIYSITCTNYHILKWCLLVCFILISNLNVRVSLSTDTVSPVHQNKINTIVWHKMEDSLTNHERDTIIIWKIQNDVHKCSTNLQIQSC